MMPKGRPFGTPQPCGNEGGLEEYNRRQAYAADNERFVAALQRARQEELRTALLIEAEMHRVPNKAELDVLTDYERALERVKQGAQIVEIRPFSKRGHEVTLAGNSSSWMA